MAYYPKYNKNKPVKKALLGLTIPSALKLAPIVGQGIKSIFSIFGGKKRRKAAEEAKKSFDLSRLEGSIPKSAQKLAEQPYDQAAVEKQQEMQMSRFATSMGNLRGDPRGTMGGVMGLEGQHAQQAADAAIIQDKARTEALTNLASYEEKKSTVDRTLAEGEMAGIKKELIDSSQQQTSGLGGLASNVLTGLATAADLGVFKKKPTEGPVKEGEDGMITDGEFNHDTNKVDVVQNGEKVAELTGEEVIMPPDDRAELESLMADGDGQGLIEKLRELFAKYEENSKAQEEEEEEEEGEPQEVVETAEYGTILNRGGYLDKIRARRTVKK